MFDDLTKPCPFCAEARELYNQAFSQAWQSRNHVRLDSPEVAGDAARVRCNVCRDRGRVLTEKGHDLAAFIRQWCLTCLTTDDKEVPF